MCKICGQETLVLDINNIKYDYCKNCGFLHKQPNFYLSETDEKARYEMHQNDSPDYYQYKLKFVNEIKDYLGLNVLDFGSGPHHPLSNVLIDNNYNVKYYDKYFDNNDTYLSFKYDSIILDEVIEHLEDPLSIISDLYKLLNQSGNFIIRTNFNDDKELKSWWYLRDKTHISIFNSKTFDYLAKELGLRILFSNHKDLIILNKSAIV